MMQTTGEKVLAYLTAYGLKDERNGQWRCNSPLRPGANSHSFTLRIDADGEHGAFDDKAGGDSGSLYDLAGRLGIAPESMYTARTAVLDSNQVYSDLKAYAEFKGVPVDVFLKAKWSAETVMTNNPGTKDMRPAFEFQTKTGKRYRFADGQKPKFKSVKGYQACWYGLNRAVLLAKEKSLPLVICNGEPSVLVASHYSIPACAITGGEKSTIPAPLLAELKAAWNGAIILALDCDAAGRKSAAGKAVILRAAGYTVQIIDLGLGDKGDVADLCKLHTVDTMQHILKLAQTPEVETPAAQSLPTIPVVKRSERLSNYINNLTDFETPRLNAGIPFPLKVMHKFGGMALTMKPGKAMAVVGISGGGKTSVLEMMIDGWLRYNVGCIAWSPEWTADEFIERAVQRYGGPRTDEVYRHEIFIDEQQRGIKGGFGIELSQYQLESASNAVKYLRQFESEVGYLNMPLLSASYLRQALPETLARLSFRPRVLAIDYIQLLAALEPGNTSMYDLIMQIKAIGTQHGLCTVLASQVTKSSAKGQQHNKVLNAMDARYVNDDAFNLFMTINPDRNDIGEYLPSAVFSVAKNSLGIKGKVRVAANWERLSFADTEHFNQKFGDDD